MSRYRYKGENLRCKVTNGLISGFDLKIEKRILFLWVGTYFKISVEEGSTSRGIVKTGEPLIRTTASGYRTETWPVGKLNMKERIDEFFIEYENELRKVVTRKKDLQELNI